MATIQQVKFHGRGPILWGKRPVPPLSPAPLTVPSKRPYQSMTVIVSMLVRAQSLKLRPKLRPRLDQLPSNGMKIRGSVAPTRLVRRTITTEGERSSAH